MERLGLDEFILYILDSIYGNIFNQTTESHITLFVPTNEAVRRGVENGYIPDLSNPLDLNLSQLVQNHLVLANVTAASLRLHTDKIYVNANGHNLHKVAVTYTDVSSVSYSQNPYSNPGGRASTTVSVSSDVCYIQCIITYSFLLATFHQWSKGGVGRCLQYSECYSAHH